jgi:subfamily B ATP-binding cassette protein MsbA
VPIRARAAMRERAANGGAWIDAAAGIAYHVTFSGPSGGGVGLGEQRSSSVRDVFRLTRFLYGFVRPYWKLLIFTAVVTGVNAIANASRAFFAGAFERYVLDPAQHHQHKPKFLERWATDHLPLQALLDWWQRVSNDVLRMPPVGPEYVWDWARFLAVALGVVSVFLAVSEYGKELLQQSLVLRVINAIREKVCAHLLSLSLRFFHGQRIGDLYSRLTNDIGQSQSALSFLFGDIFEDIFRIAALAIVCLVASPWLSLVSLVAAPAVVVPLQLFGRKVRKKARSRQISQADVTEAMQQMITGVRIVKAFGAEGHEVARFHDRNEAFIRKALRVVQVKAASKGLLELVNHLIVIVLIFVGSYFLFHLHWVEKDDLITFMVALGLMYEPAKKLVKSYNNMLEALAGLDRIEDLLALSNDVADAPDAAPLGSVRGDVRVRGVSFAYKEEVVLRDISLEARAGEVVALVGPSGGGKSTLVDLIARFYDPDAGAIEIDGNDVRRVTRASLVGAIAMVTQEPFLFNDTVLENVRYGRRDASRAEVEAACRAANIHEAVAALPAGYDSVVGERGATLSGGQRQRLTIARALLKDPKILLLDEATSALDSESEKAVQAALERLMKGRTTFVVAHRLSTIVGADRIHVIERGRVVESGRHEELVAKGGLYAKLWRLQAGGVEAAAAVEGAP